jgi:D-alanine-D-alanine ligase
MTTTTARTSARRLARATVAVLAGGGSGEREVSLDSGREIVRALAVEDGRGPAQVRSIEIDARGRWNVRGEWIDAASALAALRDVDVFFLALHGGAGEDGTLQGLLESAGCCHTGSRVRGSAVCMDKLATRGIAAACGVRTSPGLCFTAQDYEREPEAWLERAAKLSTDALVVKPRCGGSSVLTAIVAAGENLRPAVEQVLASGDDCLVESCARGIECSCGVLGNRGEAARALPPIEIRPAAGRFFDYQQKYSSDGAREVCPPESLDAASVQRVQSAALALYAATGCDGYARVDFIVSAAGEPVVLEVNTLPGFTSRSLLPQEAAAIGMDYRSLCLWVLEAALRRSGSSS